MIPFNVLKKREPIQRMAALIAELKADALKARSEMFKIHMQYRNSAHNKLADFFEKTYHKRPKQQYRIPANTDFCLSIINDPTTFTFDHRDDADMCLGFWVQCGSGHAVHTVIDMRREMKTSCMNWSQKVLVIIAGGLTDMELLAGKFNEVMQSARDLVMRLLMLTGTKEASE
jgi:hypothetical protein